MRNLTILGSTGSIGKQSLDVAKKHNMKVTALSANTNTKILADQAREFSVKYVCIYDESKYNEMKTLLSDTDVKVVAGMEGLCEIASLSETDTLLNSVVGMIGLKPTLCAIEAGKDIALANKETLVAGGRIVTEAVKRKGVKLLPVDSEHSAIFQSLQGNKHDQVNRIILTASGGPFFGKTKADLENVTVADALNHPNWSMGAKITIDSATMMNKGLEIIEAAWLFDLPPSKIDVVIHRQSVIHSLVEYADYSTIAQLGVPDMHIPIQYALTYPDRYECPVKQLSLTDYKTLTFEEPDYETFVCLKTARKAFEMGNGAACIANSANEQAVALFLQEKIKFLDIGRLVSSAVEEIKGESDESVEAILNADKTAREFVLSRV